MIAKLAQSLAKIERDFNRGILDPSEETGFARSRSRRARCEVRLRPILMTTFAFVMGIIPLVFTEGAGANSRHSLGTAVCGGMIVSSVMSLLVVPVVYVFKDSTLTLLKRKAKER